MKTFLAGVLLSVALFAAVLASVGPATVDVTSLADEALPAPD